MIAQIQPKVTLVGAGPGDPDLITMAGIKAIQSANVILYDALVNTAILDYAPEDAELIFVGKRKGFKKYPQEEINYMLVAYALRYGNVVRLKGGDSFVFGRGAEEIDFVQCFNIETRIIPGISSSIAVPSSIGIPVTKRGVSQSFWVITGTTSERTLSKDVTLAAQSSATVVILMGMTHLGKITQLYKELGRGTLPIAIIQNGFRENEKTAIADIDNIEAAVAEKGLSSPAVIVIGEVVAHASNARHLFEDKNALVELIKAQQ